MSAYRAKNGSNRPNVKTTLLTLADEPTSGNAKILAADTVPLHTNLEPKPNAFARLWGWLAQVVKCSLRQIGAPAITALRSATKC
jgi:hypothetical protein